MSIEGEMDTFSAQSVFYSVSGLELDGHQTVVLDLSGLSFCDAGGISALLRVNRFLCDHDRRVVVHGISGLPRRVFTLTGADQIIELE